MRCRYLADFWPGPFSQIFAHVIHEPDEERDGGEKEEEGGERQVARPHHVQRFPVRAQRESQRGYWTLDTSSLYLSL